MHSYDVPHRNEGRRTGGFFLAADPRSRKIKELGQHVASTGAPLLIVGESGVGNDRLPYPADFWSRDFRATRSNLLIWLPG